MTQKIGIIGGSGLYKIDQFELVGTDENFQKAQETIYGLPSSPIKKYTMKGVDAELYFLARHGENHHLNPSEVPYRANVLALKQVGVDWIISVSAVGSLQEEIAPRDMVVIDQFIDRTKGRPSTFFHDGIVAHISFGDPVCATLRQYLLESTQAVARDVAEKNSTDPEQNNRDNFTVHDGGTYVCMEGPAFSTRAESNMYRSWGASVIGMTNLPEAKLAREAEISYATLAMSTDYDCWNTDHGEVSVDEVVANMNANITNAKDILLKVIPKIASHEGDVPFKGTIANSIISKVTPPNRKYDLKSILGK
jgi:5'-methylthioadenosine phosphorylase